MNIFALELVEILGKHKRDLGSLFSLRVPDSRSGVERPIPPSKVVRLRRSLERDITATLNSEELEALQTWAPLDTEREEMRRLRAALVAEGVRHLLAGRIQADEAYRLGKLAFQSLIGDEIWRDELVETVRGFSGDDLDDDFDDEGFASGMLPHGAPVFASGADTPSDPLTEETPSARALEEVAEAYEQGALWLAIAADTSDRLAQSGYIALARSLFERARDMALHAPPVALDTPEQAAWLAAIEAALREASLMRERG